MTTPPTPVKPIPPPYEAALALTSTVFPAQVFHYTDQAGFLGLLRDKAIWATDLRYLNDSREYSIGFERIVAELEKCSAGNQPLQELLLTVLHDVTPARAVGVYVTSFSLVEDDLSQWRAYSGGSGGLSIGFDPGVLSQRILLTGSSFGAVRYREEEHQQTVAQLCSELLDDAKAVLAGHGTPQDFPIRCALSVQLACALMKHHKFDAEREWRMIVWSALPPYITRDVRRGRSAILPYVSVRLDVTASQKGLQFANKLPLADLWVGPTPHADLAMRGAWLSLNTFGETANLKLSQVPFRNW